MNCIARLVGRFWFHAFACLILVNVVGSGCSVPPKELPPPPAAPSTPPLPQLEVRGYVMKPGSAVPQHNYGYGFLLLTNRVQAQRLCSAFRGSLTFSGQFDQYTALIAQSVNGSVGIVPFIWPVTSWNRKDKNNCDTLVDRYNYSGARTLFHQAQLTIRKLGGTPTDALNGGPFLVTYQNDSKGISLYDLSHAPYIDYQRWLLTAVEQLSTPGSAIVKVIHPSPRDQVRAFVFGTIPTWDVWLGLLIPKYHPAPVAG